MADPRTGSALMAIPSGALEQPAEYSDAEHAVEYALARGDAAPAGRQTSHNGAGHPGREEAVQVVTISAKTGWSGPRANQQTISTPAQISIPIQYDRLQNTHVVRASMTER